ncbi:hypothetical protein AB0M20_21905, partial [Actinoplanes sp. NPDC051633]|uniref:hypothetical protein n=1 Tax=Actinoplanes sp. NPDC051633 TaxID=3155670 RepID=UPI00342D4C0E
MNLVFIVDELETLGGVQKVMQGLGSALASLGHRIYYVTLHDTGVAPCVTGNEVLYLSLPRLPQEERRLPHEARSEIQRLLSTLASGCVLMQSPSVVAWLRDIDFSGFARVGQYHGSYEYAASSYHGQFIRDYYSRLDWSVFPTTDDAMLFQKNFGIGNGVYLPEVVIPIGVGERSIERAPRVLSVGRLSAEKGFFRLIDA